MSRALVDPWSASWRRAGRWAHNEVVVVVGTAVSDSDGARTLFLYGGFKVEGTLEDGQENGNPNVGREREKF